MPHPIGLRHARGQLRFSTFEQLKRRFNEVECIIEVVADIVGSKAQNCVTMSDSRILFRPISLKYLIAFVVLPAINFDDEFVNEEVEAVPRDEHIMLRVNPFRPQTPAEVALRSAVRAYRGVSNRLFQPPGHSPHPLLVFL